MPFPDPTGKTGSSVSTGSTLVTEGSFLDKYAGILDPNGLAAAKAKASGGSGSVVWDGSAAVSATDLKKSWLTLPKEDKLAVIAFTTKLGKKPSQAKTVWGQLVDAASASFAKGEKTTVWQTLSQASASSVSTGLTASGVPRATRAPASADLNTVVQRAFAETLGRSPTAEERDSFTKQFQSLALSIGNSENASSESSSFTPVTSPASFLPPGQTPPKSKGKVSKKSAPLEYLPDASVAATNFALRAQPSQAASNGMNNAIGSWLGNLAKGSTNGR